MQGKFYLDYTFFIWETWDREEREGGGGGGGGGGKFLYLRNL